MVQCLIFRFCGSDTKSHTREINEGLAGLEREGKQFVYAAQSTAPNSLHGTETILTVFYR